MFHPGKVLSVLRVNDKTVFGSDKSVQAVVSMWDDNLLTAEVEPGLGSVIREGDVVLLDYSPKYSTIPVPKQLVVKILRMDAAKTVWSAYQDKVSRRKSEAEAMDSSPLPEGGFHIR